MASELFGRNFTWRVQHTFHSLVFLNIRVMPVNKQEQINYSSKNLQLDILEPVLVFVQLSKGQNGTSLPIHFSYSSAGLRRCLLLISRQHDTEHRKHTHLLGQQNQQMPFVGSCSAGYCVNCISESRKSPLQMSKLREIDQ